MNILYVNSHDTGRYVSPHGHRVRSPRLQRLAEEGVLFREAFSAAPTCSPSRAALCTGQVPHSCGMLGLGNCGFACAHPEHHLAVTLRDSGYETAAWEFASFFNFNHMGIRNAGLDHRALGYEIGLSGPIEEAIDYLRKPHARPFFLSASFVLTHRPFATPRSPKDDPRYVALPPTLPDVPAVREDWAHFLSDVEAYDAQVGRLLDALDEAGIADDTLVIATTDHGVPFPGMKCNLTVHGTGVFLILRGPQGLSDGKVVDAMVSQLDLFPTICELAGIAKPEWLEGTSLLPLVRGEATQLHDEIFAEVTYHAAYQPMRSLRTPRWNYVRRFGGRRRPVLPNIDASPSKSAWLKDGYGERELPEEMLFDVFYDPQEMNDLATRPEHQATLLELRARLEAWMKRTADPLLSGKPPKPPGAWETPPDDVDPGSKKG